MSGQPEFCWCCGLPLDTRGACALCDYVGVACDPPHECMKRGGTVIGPCHDAAPPDDGACNGV